MSNSSNGVFVLNDRAQAVQPAADGALDVLMYDDFDIEPGCGGAGCGGAKLRTWANVTTTLWVGVGSATAVRAAWCNVSRSRVLFISMLQPPSTGIKNIHSLGMISK